MSAPIGGEGRGHGRDRVSLSPAAVVFGLSGKAARPVGCLSFYRPPMLVFGSLLCCRQIHVYLAACLAVHTLVLVLVKGVFHVLLDVAPESLSLSLELE